MEIYQLEDQIVLTIMEFMLQVLQQEIIIIITLPLLVIIAEHTLMDHQLIQILVTA